MTRIGLVGCVKSKHARPAQARDLYASALFRGRRAAVEGICDQWFVLSAKHGLVAPDAMIEPYDVALKDASMTERRRWAARVLEQLRAEVGKLRDVTFEIHAGASYRDFGLVDGLRRAGAQVENPVEGLNQGQQLAFYAGTRTARHASQVHDVQQGAPAWTSPPSGRAAREHDAEGTKWGPLRQVSRVLRIRGRKPTAQSPSPRSQLAYPRPDSQQPEPAKKSQVKILSSAPLVPFTYHWPENVEEFSSGWEFQVRFDGQTHRVRYGIGRRDCFGRMRVHTVAWLDGVPVVEGAEAEDFAVTREIVSVLKMTGGKRDARSLDDVDPAYATFNVVTHSNAIAGPNARHGLAVRIREDDFGSWAQHALLRSRAKATRPVPTVKPRRQPPASAVARPIPVEATNVVKGLLAFGRSLAASKMGSFTPDPAADAFVRNDAFAFLVAVICDEQVRFEAAWEAPLRLRERLDHWDIPRLASGRDAVRAAFTARPALHRWVTVTADRVVDAAARVLADYCGDARRIWSDRPSAQELRRRFESFDGIGQKKSAMAVELLERQLHEPLRDLAGSDVAVDVHVRRVFLRTGLAERDAVAHIVAAARSAHPERPGELDYPAWEIGRVWCRPTNPGCDACPLGAICPRLIDRATGVRGA